MSGGANQFRVSSCIRLLLVVLCTASLPNAVHGADPWEKVNRNTFRFNDFLDRVVLRPVAAIYNDAIPRPIKVSVSNFFSNINDVNVLINNTLQFKFDNALSDSGRLLINTTVGVGGLFDVADRVGLVKNEEDFGQTLAAWNMNSGPYLVLPLFGPSTVRGAFGRVVDITFNPLRLIAHEPTQIGLFATHEVDHRASMLNLDELIVGDRYLFLREAYLQRREYLVSEGETFDQFGFGSYSDVQEATP